MATKIVKDPETGEETEVEVEESEVTTPEEVTETEEEKAAREAAEAEAKAAAGDDEESEEKPKKIYDADYWKGEYYREKKKRQGLQTTSFNVRPADTSPDPHEGKPLNELTIEQFEERVLVKAKKQARAEVDDDIEANRLVATQDQARLDHDGSDGLPEYDSIVDEVVVPLIKKNPSVYYLLRKMANPAEAAYTFAMLQKFPNLVDSYKEQGRDDLVKKINSVTKKAVVLKGKKDTTKLGTQTAADIMAMSPDQFEKEIAKVTGRDA